ncbi:MAG: hypothetical protein EOO77_31940, partial [Oxalobacteraceae bacterium]
MPPVSTTGILTNPLETDMTGPADSHTITVSSRHPILLLSEICSFDVFSDLVVIDSSHACLMCRLSDSDSRVVVAYGSLTEDHDHLRAMFRLANAYTAVVT